MTVQTVPYALQNASHSAALFRQSASAAFTSGGILAAGELTITQQGTPNMSVVLGAGRAKIAGTSVSPPSGLSFTTQGMYDVLNDAPLTLTVAAADATNPRIDVPYVQVQDSFYSGAANQAIAGIVTGTPAPSPTTPAVPSNAIGLNPIAVAANATSIVSANIGAAPVSAALNGGFLKVPTLSLLNVITGQTGQHATVYADGANNGDYLWDGTSWDGIPQRIILQRVATAQSIPNGATTTVTYDGTDLVNKIGAAFSTVNRAAGLLTCGVAGTYMVRGDVDYAFNATGIRQLFVDKALAATPTTFVSQSAVQPGTFTTAGFPTSVNVESFVTLAVGDVLRLSTAQSSGGALNVTAHLTIDKVA